MAYSHEFRRWLEGSRTAAIVRAIGAARETSWTRRLRGGLVLTGGRLAALLDGTLIRGGAALGASRVARLANGVARPGVAAAQRIPELVRSSLVVSSLAQAGSRGLGLALLLGIGVNTLLVLLVGERVGTLGWVARALLAAAGLVLLGGLLTWPTIRDARIYRWIFPLSDGRPEGHR